MKLKKTYLSEENTKTFLEVIGLPQLLEVESPEAYLKSISLLIQAEADTDTDRTEPFHVYAKAMGDSKLSEMLNDPYHTNWWEIESYFETLEQIAEDKDTKPFFKIEDFDMKKFLRKNMNRKDLAVLAKKEYNTRVDKRDAINDMIVSAIGDNVIVIDGNNYKKGDVLGAIVEGHSEFWETSEKKVTDFLKEEYPELFQDLKKYANLEGFCCGKADISIIEGMDQKSKVEGSETAPIKH